jgi:DNA-binding transcriptional LysR family regulator
MPGVCEYLQRNTETEVSVMFVDRVVNLLEEGLDVGLRIGKLPDSSMRALLVGKVRIVLCASPKYLHKHGEPKQPEDLHKHQMIASGKLQSVLDNYQPGPLPINILHREGRDGA